MPTTAGQPVRDTYMALIREFPLRRITTSRQHLAACRIATRLMTNRRDRGESEYLDVLADLIVDYERRAGHVIDTSHLTAADHVRHLMEERGWSISRLAAEAGLGPSNLSEMLSGKRDWSKNAIRSLSQMFRIRAELFLK